MNDPNDIRCALDDPAGLLGEIKRRDRIITALMNQVQRNLNNPNNDFSLLQTTFVLEEEVKRRTEELERALDALAKAKEELQKSHSELEDRVAERTSELSQQLHFLQQLIEAIPGPVFYKDAQLRYLGCNSAFEAFLGQPAGELIGKTSYEIEPSRALADEYAAADQEPYRKSGLADLRQHGPLRQRRDARGHAPQGNLYSAGWHGWRPGRGDARYYRAQARRGLGAREPPAAAGHH